MNKIESTAAVAFAEPGRIDPLDFTRTANPVSCTFTEAVFAFARVCATTADGRARAAAWGVTRGFMEGPAMSDSATGRPRTNLSITGLADLRLHTL